MKNYLLFLLFCTLSALQAQAQRQEVRFKCILRGTVMDSLERKPLAKASINIDFGTYTTVCDDKGNFEIKILSGEHNILVKHVGFRPVRQFFSLENHLTATYLMGSITNDLEVVIISSKSSEQAHQRPILGVSTLNINTLKKLPTAVGELDILRGLQMLPGVSSVGEASNGVNIRGGTTDQNLMLIDDMPIFNPTHMFGLFTAFPAEVVSSVELYKGNSPARFGGRVAAVLDVSLQNPSLNKFKLSGGVSPVSNRLVLDMPLIKEKLGIMVAGRGSYNDFLLPVISDKLNGIKANFADLVTKVFWRVSNKHTLTFSSYYSKDFFQTQLLGTVGNIQASATQYNYQANSFSGRWFWGIKPNINILTTYVSSIYTPKTLLPEINSDNVVTIVSDTKYQQLKTSANYYREKQKIEIGLNATHYVLMPGELNPGNSRSVNAVQLAKEYALETGIFAEDEITFSPKTTLSLGLRYSYFMNLGPAQVRIYTPNQPKDALSLIDTLTYARHKVIKSYGGFEPRVGLKYSLNTQTTLKLGYNLMRQYIQVVTNTTTPLPTSRWKTADTHIRPQVGSLLAGGVFHNFRGNILELSVEGYFRHTKNVVDYKPGADFLLNQYPETMLLQGINRSWGIEAMLSKKKGEVTGWISYTLARSQNRVSEGASFSEQVNYGTWYRANYDRPHTVNATVVINQGKYNDFSFNFTYSTGRPFSVPNGYVKFDDKIFPFYNVRNNERIPDYHRLDFAWNIYQPSMKDRRWKSHWSVTVYNLYARRNPYSIFFTARGNGLEAKKLVIFGSPIFSLTYNFKFM